MAGFSTQDIDDVFTVVPFKCFVILRITQGNQDIVH